MTAIGESFQQCDRFTYEIVAFCFVDCARWSCCVTWRRTGIRSWVRFRCLDRQIQRLGGVDHEHGEFKDEFWIVCFFRVGSVEFEGLVV